jgi:ribonuclease E
VQAPTDVEADGEPVGANDSDTATDEESAPRRGWWQRTFGQ